MNDQATYATVVEVQDLTKEILDAVENIYDGWYQEQGRIDWEDFIDRLDGIPLNDGTILDMGDSMASPAVLAIKRYVSKLRRES